LPGPSLRCHIGPHSAAGRRDAEEAAEPPLRQIIDVLQQVMCTHDAEKRAISVLEIYEGGGKEKVSNGRAIVRTYPFFNHFNSFNTVAPFCCHTQIEAFNRIA